MILLNVDGIVTTIIVVYFICHSPAIVTLIIGLARLRTKPKNAKRLLIFSGIYFLVGAGVCGSLLMG